MKMNVYWITFCCVLVRPPISIATTVNSIKIQNNAVTEKGANITLVCSIDQFSESSVISVYKTDTAVIPDLRDFTEQCIQSACSQNGVVINRKTRITADSNRINIEIFRLSIKDDEKWWTCRDNQINSQRQKKLTVYASPKSLILRGDTDGGDLQNKDVILQCQTSNCVYPAPSQIQLFYKKASSQWLQYKNMTTSSSQTLCGDSEKKYTATLQLPRYTIWPLKSSNVETTVKFQCRLDFPTLQSPLQSAESGNVVFAVRVTAVTLKDGERTLTSSDTTETVVGRQKTFTCTPTTSRPAATIVWYIDGTEKQRSTSTEYSYTPAFEDNNKHIYCKAFNIPGQTEVFSYEPALLVKVQVTIVILYDGNISPASDDNIVATENQSKILTCRTGNVNPVPTVVWYVNGDIMQNGSNANFVFTPSNNDHGKRVYCKAYNIQPVEKAVVSASPTLYVRVTVSSVTLNDGGNILSEPLQLVSGVAKTLDCETSISRPSATVVWYIGTKEKQRSNSSTSFSFIPQNIDHNKQIFCKAFNIQPESQAVTSDKTTLYVQDPAINMSFYIEGHVGETTVTVDEHDAGVRFKCIVESKFAPSVKIMFEHEIVKEQINESTLSVVRQDVSCFDSGVYICEGRNYYRRNSIFITLFVKCSPRPYRKLLRNIEGSLHVPVTFSFTALAFPEPGPKGFLWTKKEDADWQPILSNADLKISSSGLQSNLTVMNVSYADFGYYRISVTNDIGTYTQSFYLYEAGMTQTSKENRTGTDATLVAAITLGVISVALAIYASYITVSRYRLKRKGTSSTNRLASKTSYANQTFDVSGCREQDGSNASGGEATFQQYTDLFQCSNTDKDTYDVIKK